MAERCILPRQKPERRGPRGSAREMRRRTFLTTAAIGMVGAALPAAARSKFRAYAGPEITQIVVHKAKRRMYLVSGTNVVKHYRIALGGNPVGPKRFEGDGKTPEGLYYIDRQNH